MFSSVIHAMEAMLVCIYT